MYFATSAAVGSLFNCVLKAALIKPAALVGSDIDPVIDGSEALLDLYVPSLPATIKNSSNGIVLLKSKERTKLSDKAFI